MLPLWYWDSLQEWIANYHLELIDNQSIILSSGLSSKRSLNLTMRCTIYTILNLLVFAEGSTVTNVTGPIVEVGNIYRQGDMILTLINDKTHQNQTTNIAPAFGGQNFTAADQIFTARSFPTSPISAIGVTGNPHNVTKTMHNMNNVTGNPHNVTKTMHSMNNVTRLVISRLPEACSPSKGILKFVLIEIWLGKWKF